jgi:hypothetical protein
MYLKKLEGVTPQKRVTFKSWPDSIPAMLVRKSGQILIPRITFMEKLIATE